MPRASRFLPIVLALSLTGLPAIAAELAGVSLPDEVRIEDRTLVLNGLGLREATFLKIDVYVAGLYVERRSTDPVTILDPAQTKRIVMRFVRNVSRAKLVGAWDEGFAKSAPASIDDLRPSIAELNGWMADVASGETIAMTWIPGKGTEVEIAGRRAGTIAGEMFARALFSIWLGDSPPNEGLKEGLLGRS